MEDNVKTLIKNGWVIDPAQKINQRADIIISGSEVVKVYTSESPCQSDYDDVIDAEGYLITPGFIDLHVHLREPGLPHKETIYTGSRACAKGGFTTVACMANTNPVIDTVKHLNQLKTIINRDSVIDIKPIAAITLGLEGKKLTDHDALLKEHVFALSDDGKTTMDDTLMRMAFKTSHQKSIPIITHSEDHDITSQYKDTVYPIEAEYKIVERDIALCEAEDGILHVAHVSGKKAISYIRDAKKRGLKVTCEVAPHHFALNDQMIDVLDPMSKVNPPIRSEEEQLAVIEAIKDETIDIIATDHAPHEIESKQKSYGQASYGISGIETAFAVAYTHLVKKSHITLYKLIEMMTIKPAQIGQFEKIGTLKPGCEANLVLIDLEKPWVIDRHAFLSKGKNSPFHQMSVYGEVAMTLYRGKKVYQK